MPPAGEGIEAGVIAVAVNDDEEARRLRFPGNPMIRLDGEDLFPAEGTANGRDTGGRAAAGTPPQRKPEEELPVWHTSRSGLFAIIGPVPERPRTAAATDLAMMRQALLAAEEAAGRGEVPVGAVVARGDKVLAVAANEREATGDPTAHAELLAIREAANALGGWRLAGCTLYATLEPCPMCAGAAHAARLDRLVYATPDPKAGYAGTLHDVTQDPRLNHTLAVRSGLLEKEAADMLRSFFKDRRKRPPKPQDPPQIPG